MKFEFIKKVPIVEIGGKKCFIDTGCPYAVESHIPRVHQFFGIPDLHVAGVKSLGRYTKFDYSNCEITTSGDRFRWKAAIPCRWRYARIADGRVGWLR